MTGYPHPHLPVPMTGNLSVWQRSTRNDPLLNEGRNVPLPAEASVVIVGSGMCGAVVGHTLLAAENRPEIIVVLEAREICSGASGRNAGHCRPDPFRSFAELSGLHGKAQAKKVLNSEAEVFRRVDAFVRQHEVDCEWQSRRTYEVCLTEEYKAWTMNALRHFKAAGGQVGDLQYLEAEEAKRATRVKKAVGAFAWQAGNLNPAKFTLHVHRMNKACGGYSLYAWTPVHGVTARSDGKWTVQTSRGEIRARQVVFATNAYTQSVVPEMKDLVVPWHAQAVLMPPAPVGKRLFPYYQPSGSMRNTQNDYYSVCQRPDYSIVLNTSREWPGKPKYLSQKIDMTVDDRVQYPEMTKRAVQELSNEIFPEAGWSDSMQDEGDGKGFSYHWTGIIGMTLDSVPYIGPIPGKPGQFIAAGYHGHGMARILLTAPAIARLMLTGEWDTEMPECFRLTPSRLAKLRRIARAKNSAPKVHVDGVIKPVPEGAVSSKL